MELLELLFESIYRAYMVIDFPTWSRRRRSKTRKLSRQQP